MSMLNDTDVVPWVIRTERLLHKRIAVRSISAERSSVIGSTVDFMTKCRYEDYQHSEMNDKSGVRRMGNKRGIPV